MSALLVAVMLVGIAPIGGIDLSVKSSAMDLSSYKVGDLIEFGSYPQSKVTDEATIAALESMEKDWHSYGYYSGTGTSTGYEKGNTVSSDYMKYADLSLNGKRYRSVCFSQYRPLTTVGISSSSNSRQDENGYFVDNTYYFVYEPLTWRVLDPDEGFVMSDKVIDSQPYQNFVIGNNGICYNDRNFENYATDWATSSLCEWLNNDFYNAAFSNDEKSQINVSHLENKSVWDLYDCVDSFNKIFIISYFDSINSKYGFNSSHDVYDTARQLKGTDYSKCQGCLTTHTDYTENSEWLLRTSYSSSAVTQVSYDGYAFDGYYAHYTNRGVVPAFKFSKMPSKNVFSYTINEENNTATITGCDSSVTGDIVVPETIDSYKVEEIASTTFLECKEISSITVSKGISKISFSTKNCNKIEYVNLPLDSDFSKSALHDAAEVFLENGKAVFKWNSADKTTTLNIGADITENDIGKAYKSVIGTLDTIKLNSNNPNLALVDGVLYNHDVTTLVLYPIASTNDTYIMPDTLLWTKETKTACDILYYAYNLRSITIGANYNIGTETKEAFDEFYEDLKSSGGEEAALYFMGIAIFGLGDGANCNCSFPFSKYLKEINVSPKHHFLKSVNGILGLKNDNYNVKLVYPAAKEGTIILDKTDICYVYSFIALNNPHKIILTDEYFDTLKKIGDVFEANGESGAYEKIFNNLLYSIYASEFSVSNHSKKFYVDDSGVLFNKEKNKMIKFPVGSKKVFYEVPSNIEIADTALIVFMPLSFEFKYPKNTVFHVDNVDNLENLSKFLFSKEVCTNTPKDKTFTVETDEGEEIVTIEEFASNYNDAVKIIKQAVEDDLQEKQASSYNEYIDEFGNNKFAKEIFSEFYEKAENLYLTLMGGFFGYTANITFCNGHEQKCTHILQHITVPSSCTVNGMEYDICTECGETFNEKVIPMGHKLNHVVVPSTCKVAGMEYDICSECGETFNEKTLPLEAHTWSEWTVVKEATTTAEGQEKRTCSACGEVETRAIEKLKALVDEKTGVEINYNDEYEANTEIKVEEQFSGKSFQLLNTEYGKVNSKIYDIATYKDGVKVQPDGEITVRIPLPDGFTTNKVFVCYVDSVSGKVTKIPCEVKDGYVTFKTNHFSEYAIVEQLANVKSVSIGDITMNYKKSAKINPSITADNGAEYTVSFSSSNPSVARVDDNGNIYGAKRGSATITCTVTDSNNNTVSDSCDVKVKYSFGQWLIVILLFGWIWY